MLAGTKGPDKIRGKGGNDRLKGKGGNDLLNAGKGRDAAIGGTGADKLRGGPGDDLINAADGRRDNAIAGGPGKNTCILDTTLELTLARGCTTIRSGPLGGGPPGPGEGLRVLTADGLTGCRSALPTCQFSITGDGADAPAGTVTGTGGVTAVGAAAVTSGTRLDRDGRLRLLERRGAACHDRLGDLRRAGRLRGLEELVAASRSPALAGVDSLAGGSRGPPAARSRRGRRRGRDRRTGRGPATWSRPAAPRLCSRRAIGSAGGH